ncbi:MAG: ABC transporter permease [Propionibacterium sp.]|nr:MAG: ABC transporter permease [Propionibacterium sp.]
MSAQVQHPVNLPSLTLLLTRARWRHAQGDRLLYGAGILAYVISSLLLFTVAGGTWALWNRWHQPTGLLQELVAADPEFAEVLAFYFVLAVFACVLVVPPIKNLAAEAVLLGARGRERRLATLRLVGLSAGDISKLASLESILQAGIGTAIGTVGYLVTLPGWQALTLQAQQFRAAEMLLPWWGLLAGWAALGLIALFSTWWGLRQVRISPLGVARRALGFRAHIWRLVSFVVILAVAGVANFVLRLSSGFVASLVLAAVLLGVLAGFNLVGPWVLHWQARLLTKLPWTTTLWASRRIAANSRMVWGRVAGIGLLAFITGYVALMPISPNVTGSADAMTFIDSASLDIVKGTAITLAFSLIVSATSIFITQTSAVYERAEQTSALAKMGTPARFQLRVMWLETFGPLLSATGMGYLLGLAMGLPALRMAAVFGVDPQPLAVLGVTLILVLGLGLSAIAVWACHPLLRRTMTAAARRGD